MNKPMREKPRTRNKKTQEAVADDPLPGLMKEWEDLWRRFFQDQQATFEQAVAAGTAAFRYEDPYAELQYRWQNFIREEITNRFLLTPVGPLRQYQEKFNRLMQAFAKWETACQSFIMLMNRAMTQSLADLQQKINDQCGADGPVDDLFPLWVRLYEKHSLSLFHSAEFMAAMHEALNAKAVLTKAQQDLMEDILKAAHIPTLRDMDDLSRELYLLKKKVQVLEETLKDRHGRTR